MSKKNEEEPDTSPGAFGKLGTARVRIEMTPNEAFEFLAKLGSDDRFRERLQENPREELAKYHIVLPPGDIPKPVTLPPKSALKEAYDKITLSKEFRSESAALTAAAIGYVWFHPIFTGWRFRLVAPRRETNTFGDE